ncbi:MAG: pyruvate, phosphate dikinase [Solirubrobacteraceae bacterium]|jgi:pyruvate,orthophosphate dikinase
MKQLHDVPTGSSETHKEAPTKYVYDFAEGSREMRELLGGKGAGLCEMTRQLGDDVVPAGFVITTGACVEYMRAGSEPPELEGQVTAALARLEAKVGRRFGDPADPLLISVRSGARESMPGMMDTVLNLGLTDESVQGLARATKNERFAWDSYRRFVQMFANVVRGVSTEKIEGAIAQAKKERGVQLDTELDVDALKELTAAFKALFREQTGEDFPQDPGMQLQQAMLAVFDSWMGARAVAYRRINQIPADWGTAVNVQQMVFGNRGDHSCSGVAFSRDEVTGAPEPSGDFLINAQGEDVVSGVRNTQELSELRTAMPEAYEKLTEIMRKLEGVYGDMQDTEFTVEEGRLYMLQTRNAKRPAQAAVRFAVDAVSEGLLDKAGAIKTIDAGSLDALLHPTFDPHSKFNVLARGVAASPGAAKGTIVLSAPDAIAAAEAGEAVILVRPFTEAEDVAGFFAARGILTSEGGKASHAALVARGMGRPCVCGASALHIDLDEGTITVNGTVLHAGDKIAINGSTGEITTDDVVLINPEIDANFDTVLGWCDELRTLSVRANADVPEDARRARGFGAEGIGLCRTEHMFMAEDRQPKMRAMIMADTEAERLSWLEKLLPLQQSDFEGLFETMEGQPVTIRLLDPPLHEFLPSEAELVEELREAANSHPERMDGLHHELARVRELSETNPMLGTRGCRLGILYPEIYEMQVRAIMRSARAVRERTGSAPHCEVMIPLVNFDRELTLMRELVIRVADAEGMTLGTDYTIGTMIELPRACAVADVLAKNVEFFSFGTNDLTQTTLGFSRDDVEGAIVPQYISERIITVSPFETIDRDGVGMLVKMAVTKGREANPEIELGVCGEHGGDPKSIAFFAEAGLDYVSCSPFRVPVARVAAAQAAIAKSDAAKNK